MNSKIIFLIIICIFFNQLVFGQNKVKFDVKTKMNEKINLSAAKNGLIYFIQKSDKYTVSEFNEDYSLWLKNYEVIKNFDTLLYKCIIEVRTPAMIREGKLLAKEEVWTKMIVNKSINNNEINSFEAFKKEAKDIKKEMYEEAFLIGRTAFNKIDILLKRIERFNQSKEKHNN